MPALPTWTTLAGGLAGAAIALAGAAWIARSDLAHQRDAFETDARIAHRLLSQRVVQHDAMLATLALLQPGPDRPEQRLPALYPQVLQVLRRDRGAAWPDPGWQAAEAESRTQRRATIAALELGAGRYTLLQAAEPASFALQIDVARVVPWAEWPMRRDGAVRVELRLAGESIELQPGAGTGTLTRFEFSKHLAAASQPFEMHAARPVGWAELPWALMATWVLAVGAATALFAAWQAQRLARRRAEERLRLGQVGRLNALGELAAGMAHELNQPLTAVLANTQAAGRLLADDPPELGEAREAMAQAAQQARRASEVVARLRRVVQRPDAAAMVRPVALGPALHQVLDLLEPELAQRGVVARIELPASVPAVQADPVAFEQIVHNLVTNALQALEQVPAAERALELAVERGDGEASVVVRDSGPGIPADALPHVFEPFFTTRAEGLGLGLSLSETLAIGMGGRLSAAHGAPRGAEFRLTLPLAA